MEYNNVWNVPYALRLYFSPTGKLLFKQERGTRWYDYRKAIRTDVITAFQSNTCTIKPGPIQAQG